jgi:co-chaperonin GroES (HSP10)
MEKKMKLKPVNRWILIEPHWAIEEKASTVLPGGTVLLPDDFKSAKERYREFQVVSISEQCTKNIRQGHKIIADNTMVEIIKVGDEEFHMILENHIIALIEKESE